VTEAAEGEGGEVRAISLESLLKSSGYGQIDLLLMDIERSEREVFASGYSHWLSRTRNIAIELHDEECEAVFFRAMSGYNYQVEKRGQLTICRNMVSA
jgi:hypothetical protein